MTKATPYHRFPIPTIQYVVWLDHPSPLSDRGVQQWLHQPRIQVSHKTLREWQMKSGRQFTDDLHHREPPPSSWWYLDEVCTSLNGVRHWLWRAVDKYGFLLDILLRWI